jgi:CubicO group peptidase (beta-lactamase class C family)/uncharacterized membrane protein
MKKLAWLIFVGSCLLFSFQPVKYFLADGPVGLLNSKPLDSHMYKISFYIHIAFGGIALLVGWLQFSKKLREKYLKLHRTIGKIYVTSVLISGPFAFYIGFFVYGGIPTQIGFTLGALFWIAFTYIGYSAIRKGNVAKHKEYMMYSYAGTFAAVTLRLWLPMLMAFMSFKVAYGISVWLSWIPNVFLVYLIIHKRELLKTIYEKYRIKKVIIATLILIVIGFIVSYMSPQTWIYKSASHEGVTIEKATSLANSSFTKEKLNEIETYLKEESNTTSMVVLEHGKIVYEYGDISEISYNASVRKSILAMLYGKYVVNGTVDLHQTIGDIGIDEDDGLLPIEKQATVDHIITARSGVFHVPANGGYDTNNVKERGSKKPGSYFLYNNWDYNVAGFIFEEKTGNTVYEELEQQLAIPLGFQDWNIQNQFRTEDKDKSRYSAYHMHLSNRDMAKIGQLMLQEGKCNCKQLIAKDWIKKITTTVTPTDTIAKRYYRDASNPVHSSYGYMWWLYDRFYDNPDFEGAYSARGAFGQYITVIPKRDVVIVHKTTIDLLTLLNFSDRSSTPYWRYLWILRTLMLDGKSIEQLATEKSTNEIIEFIKVEYDKDSEYAISERLINEYAQSLAANGKYEEAILFYKLNLELYPEGYYTHRTYNYYGDCLLNLKRKKEALKLFEKALSLNEWNEVAKKEIEKLKK